MSSGDGDGGTPSSSSAGRGAPQRGGRPTELEELEAAREHDEHEDEHEEHDDEEVARVKREGVVAKAGDGERKV